MKSYRLGLIDILVTYIQNVKSMQVAVSMGMVYAGCVGQDKVRQSKGVLVEGQVSVS